MKFFALRPGGQTIAEALLAMPGDGFTDIEQRSSDRVQVDTWQIDFRASLGGDQGAAIANVTLD